MVPYKGCICTREFDTAVKKVGNRDYTEIGLSLQTKTERSIKDLKRAITQKKGRSNAK